MQLAVVAIALGLFGAAAATTSGSAAGAAAPPVIPVGVSLPLSGPVAQIGFDLRQGIQLGAAVASRTFLRGKTFKLDFQDDAFQKERSVVNFQRFISNKYPAIIGPLGSLIAGAALPIAQQSKIPALSPSAPDAGLTDIGDYVFATLPSVAATVPALLRALDLTKRPYKRPAILISSGYPAGQIEVARLKELLAQKKITPVFEGEFGATDTDFAPQVALVKNANPDVLFVTGALPATALLVKQLRNAGVTVQIISDVVTTLQSFATPAGSAANGVIGIVSYFANNPLQSRSAKAFTASYRNRYQIDPTNYSAIGYDSILALAWAIKQSNSTDPKKIRNALASLKPFPGATGEALTFTKKRTIGGDGVAVTWKDGRLIAVTK